MKDVVIVEGGEVEEVDVDDCDVDDIVDDVDGSETRTIRVSPPTLAEARSRS
jgi:hypothetical protein